MSPITGYNHWRRVGVWTPVLVHFLKQISNTNSPSLFNWYPRHQIASACLQFSRLFISTCRLQKHIYNVAWFNFQKQYGILNTSLLLLSNGSLRYIVTRKPPWYMAVFVWNFWMVMILGRRRGLNCNTEDLVPSPPWRLPTSCYSQLYIIHYYFFQDGLF